MFRLSSSAALMIPQ